MNHMKMTNVDRSHFLMDTGVLSSLPHLCPPLGSHYTVFTPH